MIKFCNKNLSRKLYFEVNGIKIMTGWKHATFFSDKCSSLDIRSLLIIDSSCQVILIKCNFKFKIMIEKEH